MLTYLLKHLQGALKYQVQHFWEKMLHVEIYDQLSIEERTMIQTQLEMGIKPAAIANGLNLPASTFSREPKRNGWIRPKTRDGPGPHVATLNAGVSQSDEVRNEGWSSVSWCQANRQQPT